MKIDKILFRDAFFCTIMTFIVAGILYFTFVNLSFLDPFENTFKDFKFTDYYYSKRFNKEQRSDIIILVNVKHADRYQLAQAVNKISAQSPRAIGLDIIFKDRKLAFTDSILKASIASNNHIVTAYFHENDSIVNSDPYFRTDNAKKGYINLNLKDQNSVIRDFIGVKDNPNEKEYAFTTKLALEAGLIDESYAEKELKKRIPINYIGNKDVFLNFEIDEILELDDIPALKDAVILMGYLGDGNTQFDIEDKHFTPLNSEWVGRAVPDTYGVVIHANILNMLAKKNLIYRVSVFPTYVLAFISCFLILVFSIRLYKRNSFVFDITEKFVQLLLSVVLLYVAILLLQTNIYLSVMPIILLSLLGIEMIDYYEYLVTYLNKKFKWESHLL